MCHELISLVVIPIDLIVIQRDLVVPIDLIVIPSEARDLQLL
jgi:hypothetical protein